MGGLGFAYNYAWINADGKCIGTFSSPTAQTRDDLITIDVYDETYVDKYYIDGMWYERVYDTDEDGAQLETYTDIAWNPKQVSN